MKIIVTGSQDWTDRAFVEWVLVRWIRIGPGDKVVHGDAKRGLDQIANRVAHNAGAEVVPIPANWSLGKGAGLARNTQILDEHPDADEVLAFHIGASPGTADMIRKARKRGHEVWTFWRPA